MRTFLQLVRAPFTFNLAFQISRHEWPFIHQLSARQCRSTFIGHPALFEDCDIQVWIVSLFFLENRATQLILHQKLQFWKTFDSFLIENIENLQAIYWWVKLSFESIDFVKTNAMWRGSKDSKNRIFSTGVKYTGVKYDDAVDFMPMRSHGFYPASGGSCFRATRF